MTEQSFALIPFAAPDLPAIAITGRISFENHLLSLDYSLEGSINDVLLPPASLTPGRKEELWKATCFEFFLAIKEQPGYWEFNMSPSGDWNIYRMDTYRRIGFREETGISELPFTFRKDAERYVLDASVDLSSIIQPGQKLQMGITAIIQTRAGTESYWALVHPGSRADFHLRESFTLPLATQTDPVE